MNMDDYIINDKIWINPENFQEILKYIDDLDLSKLTLNNQISLLIHHSDDELINKKFEKSNADWSKILNSITERGYKVRVEIVTWAGSVNRSIEILDFAKHIMKQSDKIKNKENIDIGYRVGKHFYSKYLVAKDIENTLDLCAEDIKTKSFSPLEKLVAAYKVVVGMFLGSDSNSSSLQSFDKYTSIEKFPNVIPMCQTYSQLFEELCGRLNIKCIEWEITAGVLHSVVIVEIKDDKYNIDGRYFVDITLASTGLKEYINEVSKLGVTLDDNLPMAYGTFCIGNDGLEMWSKFYECVEPVEWKFMKLSDEGISNSVLNEATEVVNEAFVINSRIK